MRRELRRKRDLPLIQLSLSVALKIFQLPAMRSSAPQAGTSLRACVWLVYRRADVRSGSRLCENSDVELERRKFVSITLNKKRTALAVTIERRKERKFCAFSARARFHTA